MWEYNDREYIKLFRKITSWEWYTDINTFKLFLHCLIKANWKPGRWRGISYERGQFITSLASLSKETGLSIQQVRTALNKLKSTGELTELLYPRKRLITVVRFDMYQGEQQDKQQDNNNQNNKETNNQVNRQATGKQQASNNRYKNNKNNKKEKNNKDAPPVAPEGAPDAYGAPPPGWDEACEKQFQEDAPQNPGKTRQDWWDFWMADEGGDDE